MAVEKIISDFVLGLPQAVRGNVLLQLVLASGKMEEEFGPESTSEAAMTAKFLELLPQPKGLESILAYAQILGVLDFAFSPATVDQVALLQELAEKHPGSNFEAMAKEAPARAAEWDQAQSAYLQLRQTTLSPSALRHYSDELMLKHPIRMPTI